MPMSSRKFNSKDLAIRFKINVRSECDCGSDTAPEPDGVAGGKYSCSIPCSVRDGRMSFS
jgi:hypothetical protein